MKFRLGLFDRPYVEVPDEADARRARRRRGGRGPRPRRSARWSSSRTTGCCRSPPGDAASRSSGRSPTAPATCSATTATSSTWRRLREMHEGVDALGIVGDGEVIAPADELTGPADDPRRAPLVAGRRRGRAMRAAPASRPGPTTRSPRRSRSPATSDVAILVLGERSGLTDDSTTGEFRDRSTLGFLGRQQELLEAVVATGTPVVLVVVSGRPLAIEWAAGALRGGPPRMGAGRRRPGRDRGRADRGGEPGRQAADLDPAARRAGAGHVPAPPDRRPLAAEGRLRRRLASRRSGRSDSGCSYTTFKVDGLRLDREELATDGGEVTVSVDVDEHRRPGRRRGRPALRPRRRGHAWPGRSASCAASAA